MTLNGLIDLPWWGYILVTLVLTHITIASVTIFQHRHQAHRALDLHPIASHFFRFWLWLTTGNVTKEWVAVHRKHHARVEGPEDPHSPWQAGIKKVLLDGTDLYRQETRKAETLEKYGRGTPDDWIERNLYTPRNVYGVVLMMAIDLICFGPIGLTMWAVQMMWIPFFAAGVINGLGHWWGYRNFEPIDGSTNISPIGFLIGGEELHNNHHAFPSSAKFSSKWWELDFGWYYIRVLEALGLATIRRIPPELTYDNTKQHIDRETVKAVVQARFIVLSHFVRDVMLRVHREELKKTKSVDRASWELLKHARPALVRERSLLNEPSQKDLRRALEKNQTLMTVYAMREKLIDIWRLSATSQEQLVAALKQWCQDAEATGIDALKRFSQKLRTYRLVTVLT
ncbi:MAG: fatty acid desaturase [Gammaproteobacteria bacterium]|nr:fatty acid desaturase [Gammaproteobacteria bacterium]